MRIKLALGLLLVIGLFLTANLLFGNITLSPSQVARVKTACLECHSVELRYSDARSIHDIHASLDCSRCHGDNSGLKTADSVHSYLEWVGIGVVSISLAGLIVNFVITSKRAKAG